MRKARGRAAASLICSPSPFHAAAPLFSESGAFVLLRMLAHFTEPWLRACCTSSPPAISKAASFAKSIHNASVITLPTYHPNYLLRYRRNNIFTALSPKIITITSWHHPNTPLFEKFYAFGPLISMGQHIYPWHRESKSSIPNFKKRTRQSQYLRASLAYIARLWRWQWKKIYNFAWPSLLKWDNSLKYASEIHIFLVAI